MGNGCCGTIPSIGLKVYSLRVNPRSKAWDLKTKLLGDQIVQNNDILKRQKETRKIKLIQYLILLLNRSLPVKYKTPQ